MARLAHNDQKLNAVSIMTSKYVISAITSACASVLATISFAPSTMAKPNAPAAETCDLDDPTPCMKRHGESAARDLMRAYQSASKLADTTCTEVISPGIGECLEHAQAVADKELNATYARAMSSIDKDEDGRKWREQLKRAQEAWLRFRDADCGDLVFSEYSNGTGAGPASSMCLIEHTVARDAELHRRYDR